MERFLVASKNKDKIHEIKEILADFPFEIVGMESIGIHTDIVEDADSFEGNALIKASTIQKQVGGYVMADDSGLCIDALDGAPGIYSSRFCGEDSTYQEKFEKIWERKVDGALCLRDRCCTSGRISFCRKRTVRWCPS